MMNMQFLMSVWSVLRDHNLQRMILMISVILEAVGKNVILMNMLHRMVHAIHVELEENEIQKILILIEIRKAV